MRTTTNPDTIETNTTDTSTQTHTQILRAPNVDNVHHQTRHSECLLSSDVRKHTQKINKLQTRHYTRAPPPTLCHGIMKVKQPPSPCKENALSFFLRVVHVSKWATSMSIPKTAVPHHTFLFSCRVRATSPSKTHIVHFVMARCWPMRRGQKSTYTCQISVVMCVSMKADLSTPCVSMEDHKPLVPNRNLCAQSMTRDTSFTIPVCETRKTTDCHTHCAANAIVSCVRAHLTNTQRQQCVIETFPATAKCRLLD